MTKTILLTGILFCLFITARAQEQTSRFSLEISGGLSFPLGNYSNTEQSGMTYGHLNTPNGWALPGPVLNLSAQYSITKTFGIALNIGGQSNKRDDEPLLPIVRETYTWTDNLRFETNPGSWKIGKILAGGVFVIPLSSLDQLYFQGKVLAGVCKTAVPSFTYTAFAPNNSQNGGGETKSGWGKAKKVSLPLAFCYQLNAGLKYLLSNKTFLTASVSYFGAQAVDTYDGFGTTTGPLGPNIVTKKNKYQLNSIIPQLGVGWAF